MESMNGKVAIETQSQAKARPRPRRVSVAIPNDLSRKVSKFAKAERRLFAPALVVLIEKGLEAINGQPPS